MVLPIVLLVIILLLAFTSMITVLIHEIGHAIAGLILLKGEITIYVGSYGNPRKGIYLNLGRFKAYLKYNPILWRQGLCVSNAKEISLPKAFIFTLAGPLASIITAAVCIYFLSIPETHGAIKLICLFLFLSSLIDFLRNIQPNENFILLHDGTITYNDGQTLKLLRQYRGVYKEIQLLNQHIWNNEIERGIELFNKIYFQNENVNILRLGISLYVKNAEYEKAKELGNHLINKTRLDSNDYCNYAIAFSHSGEHHKALDLYTKSLQLNPNNIFSLNNKGYTLNLLKQYEEAILDFNKALNIHPNFAHAYSNRGLSKIKLGYEEEGKSDIEKSIELDDKISYAYMHLGIYYKDKGKLDEALEFFKKARDLDKRTYQLNELIHETEILLGSTSLPQ